MDLFSDLSGSFAFALGLTFLGAAILLLAVAALINRARDRATYTDLATGGTLSPTVPSSEESLDIVDFRTTASEPQLRASFARALRLLRDYLPGRGARYRLPWLLSVGQAAAGKTTLLAHTELKMPFGEPEEKSRRPRLPFLWWFYDRAVALDVTGDLVLRLDGATSDQRSWTALLQQLQKHRGRRPLDGALLSIPVTEIVDFNPSDSRARGMLAQRAELLRRRLEQAQRQLGFQFPVYVLVTQCDRLPGFSELMSSCTPGELRQMFGWSNPNTPEVPYSDAWVDDAFDSVNLALDRQQMRVLYEGDRRRAETQGFLAFPAALEPLREALRIYWNQIFAGGPEGEPVFVRGLYFVGGEGFEEDERAPAVDPDFHRRVDFLGDLFGYKVLYEWSLSRPLTRELSRRKRWRAVLQVLVLGQLLLGPPILWWSGVEVAERAAALNEEFLKKVSTALSQGQREDLQPQAMILLQAANTVDDYRLRSPFLPTSWWSQQGQEVEEAGTLAYQRVVFPAFWQALESRLSSLGTGGAESAGAPEPIYDIQTVPEFQDLRRTMIRLSDVEDDYGIYGRYARVSNSVLFPQTHFDTLNDERTPAEDVWLGTCAADEADWPEKLQDLAQTLDADFRLEIPTYWSRLYYEDVLCALQLPPLAQTERDSHARRADRLRLHVEETGSLMLRQLFENNALVLDLEEMQLGIDELAQGGTDYTGLLATIDRTDEDLYLQSLAWAGEETFDQGEEYRKLLDSISQSKFLGPFYADQIQTEGDEGFQALRAQLAAYTTQATGYLLKHLPNGFAELQLSDSISGLRTVLASVVTKYAQPPPGGRLTLQPPGGTFLTWNPTLLAQAVELLDNYRTFMATQFRNFPSLRQAVNQGTLLTVEAKVLDIVAQAQSFPTTPVISSRSTLESQLQRQVSNLSLSSSSLSSLLQWLTQPPPVSGCRGNPALSYCQLATVLLNQQALLMQQLDRLYTLQNLYVPSRGSIAGWDGEGNLAWKAFGVQNAAGLDTYVANQRLAVQTLATQYARPILSSTSPGGVSAGTATEKGSTTSPTTPVASSNLPAWQSLASSAAYKRWNLILSDLDDYESKTPNNALLLLETFITTDLPAVTADTCLTVTPVDACFSQATPTALTTNPPPCDPFLTARTRLQQSVQQRCEPLALAEGDAAYRRIKSAFDARLAGRYPFAAASARPARDAAPADIAAFFAVYDAERPKVDRMIQVGERSLQRNPQRPLFPWPPRTTQAIHDFLTDLQTVRGFFAPYLTAVQSRPKVAPVPTFALQADLRPAPDQEAGGNEIIERALRVGRTTVRSGMPLPTTASAAPTWSYGTPIRLWLRWARNGPTAPQRPSEDPAARLEERTLIYDYTGPWSLLRLLQEKAAPQIQGVEDPLLLEIPTETTVPSSEPAESRRRRRREEKEHEAAGPSLILANAEVVLSLGLATADDKGTEIDLPPFPAEAPTTTVPPVTAAQK